MKKMYMYFSGAHTDYFTVIDSNHYVKLNFSDAFFRTTPHYENSNYLTFQQWQAFTGQEANSTAATRTEETRLIYNATNADKHFALSAPMTDAAGTQYSGTILVEPWKGMVLFGEGTVEEQAQDPTGIRHFSAAKTPGVAFLQTVSGMRLLLTIPDKMHVRMNLYNTRGRLVAALSDKTYSKGIHSIPINSTSGSGRALGAGCFVLHVSTGDRVVLSKTLTVLR